MRQRKNVLRAANESDPCNSRGSCMNLLNAHLKRACGANIPRVASMDCAAVAKWKPSLAATSTVIGEAKARWKAKAWPFLAKQRRMLGSKRMISVVTQLRSAQKRLYYSNVAILWWRRCAVAKSASQKKSTCWSQGFHLMTLPQPTGSLDMAQGPSEVANAIAAATVSGFSQIRPEDVNLSNQDHPDHIHGGNTTFWLIWATWARTWNSFSAFVHIRFQSD